MAFLQTGEEAYYVTANGQIKPCTVVADERNALVTVRIDGRDLTTGTFHVFRSETAAQRASKHRKGLSTHE